MHVRRLALAVAVALLSGCASLHSVDSEVASFGQWPTGRPPGTYVIERLPSQQERAAQQEPVETAARGALEKAGFKPAADAGSADVIVQVGARVTRYDYVAWNDPMWWHWGGAYWHGGYWRRSGFWRPWGLWGWPTYYDTEYSREVGLLIRDRRSGQPLYEARANSGGYYSGNSPLFEAMFDAALRDFPNSVPQPHRVTVELAQK
ncbi:MAG TPA: DUF4136 domain-containing protein [Burkholderiaceae bacterium]|nr:DUF4136 domain-containing protein [Burkholderiaceae bacterium]